MKDSNTSLSNQKIIFNLQTNVLIVYLHRWFYQTTEKWKETS